MKNFLILLLLPLSLLRGGAEPPVAVFKFVNGLAFPSDVLERQPQYRLFIATNGQTAMITLDGSGSYDPDGDAIRSYGITYYDDFLIRLVASTNPVMSFEGLVDERDRDQFSFEVVSDSRTTASLGFRVTSAADAAYRLIDDLGDAQEPLHGIGYRFGPALVASLNAASVQLGRGQTKRGIHSLRRFERLIRLQRRHLGEAATQAFLSYVDGVIDGAKHTISE